MSVSSKIKKRKFSDCSDTQTQPDEGVKRKKTQRRWTSDEVKDILSYMKETIDLNLTIEV
jgi:hypothetical protein